MNARITIGEDDQMVAFCVTHDCPAEVYADGSVSCVFDLATETRNPPHQLVPVPTERRATKAWLRKVRPDDS